MFSDESAPDRSRFGQRPVRLGSALGSGDEFDTEYCVVIHSRLATPPSI
jgi:hypothetical protein